MSSKAQPKRRSTEANLKFSRWDAIAFDVDEAQKKAKSRNKQKRESSRDLSPILLAKILPQSHEKVEVVDNSFLVSWVIATNKMNVY